ncbi:HNH endonuclease [Pseudomonas segetis]|nr:HNH endonuclease [Pseudomonas segetis]
MHFQCTAEHLRARQDGGKDSSLNIAAACKRCNRLRHSRKTAPSPSDYQRFVQKRLNTGGWIAIPPTANLPRSRAPVIE